MPWPGITAFSEAVQNPRLCFKGTELEAGEVSLNRRGTPLVSSGNFASVYRVSVGNRTYAVRCFTREVTNKQFRYGELSSNLAHPPQFFVGFEYVERGIRVKGDWYPIVKMDWVDGEQLDRFVSSGRDQPDTLWRVAAEWRSVAAILKGLHIAHNDLQHGNVMVQTDGSIRLVDYDGMFLPKFRGETSPEQGHPNYQHPMRSSEHYDEFVDNFPSLVIYLSLRAIASDPGLWEHYNQDNLIFTKNDYANPQSSKVFDRLKKSHDQAVVRLTERLEEYCALPVEKVPDLATVLQDVPLSATVPPPPTAAPSGPPRPTVSSTTDGSYRQTLQIRERTGATPTPPPAGQAAGAPQTAVPAPAASKETGKFTRVMVGAMLTGFSLVGVIGYLWQDGFFQSEPVPIAAMPTPTATSSPTPIPTPTRTPSPVPTATAPPTLAPAPVIVPAPMPSTPTSTPTPWPLPPQVYTVVAYGANEVDEAYIATNGAQFGEGVRHLAFNGLAVDKRFVAIVYPATFHPLESVSVGTQENWGRWDRHRPFIALGGLEYNAWVLVPDSPHLLLSQGARARWAVPPTPTPVPTPVPTATPRPISTPPPIPSLYVIVAPDLDMEPLQNDHRHPLGTKLIQIASTELAGGYIVIAYPSDQYTHRPWIYSVRDNNVGCDWLKDGVVWGHKPEYAKFGEVAYDAHWLSLHDRPAGCGIVMQW